MRALVASAALALWASAALAQAPAPKPAPAAVAAAKPAPAAAAAKPAKAAMTPDQKTMVSKDCSAQADAQKLTGKARKTFRSHCKSAAKAKA